MKKSFILAGTSVVLIIVMASVGLALFPTDEPQQQASPALNLIASDSRMAPTPDEASSVATPSENERVTGADERVTGPGSSPDDGGTPNPGIDSTLSQLVARFESGGAVAAADFATQRGLDLTDSGVRVVLESSTNTAVTEALVTAAGGRTETSYGNLVQAQIPIASIEKIAASPGVSYVRPPARPELLTTTSEGVGVIGAAPWQNSGIKGSGVKVAILDAGFAGYDTRVAAGELPTGVTVRSFRADGDITGGAEKHGTACAEIVYDVAPGAQLYLVNFQTEVELGNAINYLVAQGVTVVSASWVFPGSFRGNGQGTIDDMVNNARASGIFWAAAAGNQAQMHWSNYFNDTDANNWHNYASDDEGNTIVAQEGQNIDVYLTWDRWPTTNQDYDVYLYRSSDNVLVGSSASTQNGTQAPSESFRYTVPAGEGGNYWIGIFNRGSTGDARFELLCFQYFLQYQTPMGSLGGQPADAAGAMTVGAVPYNSTTLEDFSSRGPTIDGRVKPDIVAPDKVSTATYGAQGFLGTSAAAPHVAGAAAILKGAYPAYTPANIQNSMENSATDLGIPGKDYWFGSGRLNLGAAPPDTANPSVSNVQPAGSISSDSFVISAAFSDTAPSSGINTSAVNVTLDGGSITGCNVSQTGVSCPVSGVGLGAHTISGTVADNVGHSSAISGSFTVFDSTGPVVSNVLPTGFHASTFATISADYSDPAPSSGINTSSVIMTLDGDELNCSVTASSVSCPVSGLAKGWHTIDGSVADNTGHATPISGGFESGTITVPDYYPPVVTYLQPTGVIFTSNITILVGYYDIGSGINTGGVSVTLDGAVIQGCSVMIGSVACPVSSLGMGPHYVGGSVRDRAGNATPINGSFFVGDNRPPTIGSVLPTGKIYSGSTTITVAYSDSSGINQGSVGISLDGSPLSGCTVAATSVSCPVSGLALGAHTIGGSVSDNAGNTAAISGGFTVADNTVPVIDSVLPVDTLFMDSALVRIAYHDLGPSSGIDTASVRVTLDGAPLANCVATNLDTSCELIGLQFGRHLIGGSVSDNAGNTAAISGEFRIGDNVAPVVRKVQPDGTVTGDSAVISGVFSDTDPSSGIDAASLSVTLDDKPLEKCIVTEAGFSCEVSGLGAGTHKIVGTVADNAGNTTKFGIKFETCLGGKPTLSLSHRAYWASFADYLIRELTVQTMFSNKGAGTAYGVTMTGATSTNGVTLSSPMPFNMGDLISGASAEFGIRYHVPTGVGSFRTTVTGSAADICGTSYTYP
ncbi:MAG: S8 family serine peptidase [Thermoleophilia bacterium]